MYRIILTVDIDDRRDAYIAASNATALLRAAGLTLRDNEMPIPPITADELPGTVATIEEIV